jgi:hypothetical protein
MTTSKIALVTFALLLSTGASYAGDCAGQLISEPDGRLSIRSWEGRCIIDQIEASKVLSICEVGSDCGVLATLFPSRKTYPWVGIRDITSVSPRKAPPCPAPAQACAIK